MELRIRKVLFITLLGLAILIPGFAATSYNIALSGSVSATCSLTVTTSSTASALPMTSTVKNAQIASIVEKSNASSGYLVTLSSANGWLLKGTSTSLGYSLNYGTSTTAASAVDTSVAAGTATTITSSSSTTASAGLTKYLYISYDAGSSLLPEGDYTDTLTITIAGK